MQRLGWDVIRARAAVFAADWATATYEKGETQTFYNEFFAIFGVKRRTVADYEKRVQTLDKSRAGFIDLFWRGELLVEQKSAGLDLNKALGQALDYVDWLPERDRPRYILTCDFQRWRLWDRDSGSDLRFTLAELPTHITAFAFVLGRQVSFSAQAEVNIKAAELMGRLHDALEAGKYVGHDLERLLVRLLFCLFADDTGIFEPKDIFLQLIEHDTASDGGDVGSMLIELFDVLDTAPAERQSGLPAELDQFPYVNGALFAGRIRPPRFSAAMREMLLDAARFDWSKVSPAIFGSLFQSVMDKAERRAKGAHYTSETNIRKVIDPLFLDDLRAELDAAKARRTSRGAALREFQHKLARLNFLDPACGCGNFLVVAYRELRALELDCLSALYPRDPGSGLRQGFTDLALLAMVDVGQFHGIEFEEFPARIAEVAMWMADHLANNALATAFTANFARIPLKQSANIRHADALEIDWNEVLPAARCSFVMGNPPFVGFVMRGVPQQSQADDVMRQLGATSLRLDYVAAWFLKAVAYLGRSKSRIGFVATNSLVQGEQVAQLWPLIFRAGWEIAFAHRSFVWNSEARGKAHVHVVVLGLAHRDAEPAEKRLFSYEAGKGTAIETRHGALTAYLFDARSEAVRHAVVTRATRSVADAPTINVGTKPVDGGHYIFNAEERRNFLDQEPDAAKIMFPFLGGYEFISGEARWLLNPAAAKPEELQAMPLVVDRVKRVLDFRRNEGGRLAQSLSATPTAFHVTVIPNVPYLVVPEVSSERRDYVPIGWVKPPAIPSNQLLVIRHATPFLFGILTSRMQMAWLSHIGGRLKSDYRYSSGLVYNTFPWPEASDSQRARVAALAQAVLAARAGHPTASLAVLYDPLTMPADLRAAHARLDRAVDRLYRAEVFAVGPAGDRDRVEHLFGRYAALVDPLTVAGPRANRRVARRRAAVQDAGDADRTGGVMDIAAPPRRPGGHLYLQVLAAIAAGIAVGHFYPETGAALKPLGDAFIKLVKMVIAPVIFLTVATGIAGLGELRSAARVAGRAFAYFLTFSTLALILGLAVANLVRPGAGLHIAPASLDAASIASYTAKARETTITGFLTGIIPTTMVSALSDGDILQVLFVAVLTGVGLALAGERGEPLHRVLTSASAVVFRVVGILMRAAPVGAFGAMALTIGKFGLGTLSHLAMLVASFYLTALLFVLVVLGAVGRACGFSILRLIAYLKEELLLVLGTSSSEAALPSLIAKMEAAGCRQAVVGLVVPTGYSFNLDGTNIYMTLAALFIAQATDVDLSFGQQALLLGVAMLSSKGAAGVTGAGFITLAATLAVVPAVPVAGMALILGVDRFMSECRSLTNFIGNAVATIVVSKWEGGLDHARLDAALHGRALPLPEPA